MSIATIAFLFALGGGLQDPPVDVSADYVGTYTLRQPSLQDWKDGCQVRWTLSSNGDFLGQAGNALTTGKWRVEKSGGSSAPDSRTILVLDDLVQDGEVCGVAPPTPHARLDLMSLVNGTLFIVHRSPGGETGIPRTSPQVRLERQE